MEKIEFDKEALEAGRNAYFRLKDGAYLKVCESKMTPIPTISTSEGYENVSIYQYPEDGNDFARELCRFLGSDVLDDIIDRIECHAVEHYPDSDGLHVTVQASLDGAEAEDPPEIDFVCPYDDGFDYDHEYPDDDFVAGAINDASDKLIEKIRADIENEDFALSGNYLDFLEPEINRHIVYRVCGGDGDDAYIAYGPGDAADIYDQIDRAIKDYDHYLFGEILDLRLMDENERLIDETEYYAYATDSSELGAVDCDGNETLDRFLGYHNTLAEALAAEKKTDIKDVKACVKQARQASRKEGSDPGHHQER